MGGTQGLRRRQQERSRGRTGLAGPGARTLRRARVCGSLVEQANSGGGGANSPCGSPAKRASWSGSPASARVH
jgi:hypothetical protein